MINSDELKRISKFLSWVLRHHPEAIGVELNPNGWTDINTLIEKSNLYGVEFDREMLDYIVATNPKKRFAYHENFDMIRASQGHSVQVELGYKSQMPPAVLFHGTAEKFVTSIEKSGLQKGSRQHVHLSIDRATAMQVSQRHGKPYVFRIAAEKMHTDQFEFFLSDNSVWLTEHVPPQYLTKAD